MRDKVMKIYETRLIELLFAEKNTWIDNRNNRR